MEKQKLIAVMAASLLTGVISSRGKVQSYEMAHAIETATAIYEKTVTKESKPKKGEDEPTE